MVRVKDVYKLNILIKLMSMVSIVMAGLTIAFL